MGELKIHFALSPRAEEANPMGLVHNSDAAAVSTNGLMSWDSLGVKLEARVPGFVCRNSVGGGLGNMHTVFDTGQ